MTPFYADNNTCECGCGGQPSAGRRFVSGHNLRAARTLSEEHRRRIGEGQRRAWATTRERRPVGSTRLDANGYVLVKIHEGGGTWRSEHVLAMEKSIGRRLRAGEQVHHINGIKTDNRLDNLQLCRDLSEHKTIEATYTRLLAELMASGAVVYDRDSKEYRRG